MESVSTKTLNVMVTKIATMVVMSLTAQVRILWVTINNCQSSYFNHLISGILNDIFWFIFCCYSAITTRAPPPIPRNLQFGEPCGSCYCPPTYTLGDCAPGLKCKHDSLIPDLPGRCVKQGKAIDAAISHNRFSYIFELLIYGII